jgi:hypothetical protein
MMDVDEKARSRIIEQLECKGHAYIYSSQRECRPLRRRGTYWSHNPTKSLPLRAMREAPGHRGARRLWLRLESRLTQHGRDLEPGRARGHDEKGGGEDDGLARRRAGEDAVDARAGANHGVMGRRRRQPSDGWWALGLYAGD